MHLAVAALVLAAPAPLPKRDSVDLSDCKVYLDAPHVTVKKMEIATFDSGGTLTMWFDSRAAPYTGHWVRRGSLIYIWLYKSDGRSKSEATVWRARVGRELHFEKQDP